MKLFVSTKESEKFWPQLNKNVLIMKTVILIFCLLGGGIVSSFAQENIPSQHYSRLVKDYNDANNKISRTYKETGYLPKGWRVMSVAELCRLMGAKDLWMKFDVASAHNRQVDGGIFLAHHERVLINPSGKIYCAVRCSNKTVSYKFIYPHYVQPQSMQYASSTETNSRLDRIENNQAGLADDHQVINDNVQLVYNKVGVVDQKLDRNYVAIDENTRQIKKARTEAWVQTGLMVGAVILDGVITRHVIRKGSGRQTDVYNYRTITNTTTTTINNNGGGTTTVPTPGHNGNGSRGIRAWSF